VVSGRLSLTEIPLYFLVRERAEERAREPAHQGGFPRFRTIQYKLDFLPPNIQQITAKESSREHKMDKKLFQYNYVTTGKSPNQFPKRRE